MLLALALCTNLGFLRAGLYLDDHDIYLSLRGEEHLTARSPSPWDTFDYASGGPERILALRDRGLLPWWVAPRFRMRFCRPLTALGHRLDLVASEGDPTWMHAHSLLWFLLVVLAARTLFGMLLEGRWQANLATLLLVLMPQWVIPAGWLAARNVLQATALGCLAIVCHLRGRRGAGPGWQLGALLLLAAALLSSEGAVATAGFLLAHALIREEGPLASRLRSLAPAALLVGIWWLAYQAAGYGVESSGVYLAPAPLQAGFWTELSRRAATYLSLALGVGLSADLVAFAAPGTRIGLELYAAAATLLMLSVLVPRARRDRELAFWLAAAVLTVLPCCLGQPNDRTLGLALVASAGLVVRTLVVLARGPGGIVPALLGVYLLGRFLLVHPLLRPLYWSPLERLGTSMDRAARALEVRPEQVLVFVSPPDPLHVEFLPVIRRHHRLELPTRLCTLNTGVLPARLTRVSSQVLVLEIEGELLAHPYARVYRGPDTPLRSGQRIDLGDLVLRVEEVTALGSPVRITITCRPAPDGRRLRWLTWDDGRYVDLDLPAVGETREIAPTVGPGFPLDEMAGIGDLLGAAAARGRHLPRGAAPSAP